MTTRKRNLYILMVANLLMSASMTMIMPFLSLYIETFGDYSDAYVQRWAGYIFGVTFLVAFIFSPIWGRIGDKHGYKGILILTSVGLSICIFLMGFAHSVTYLLILRIFMGVVTGFIGVSNAFIARQTPRHEAGKILGTLQLGGVTGMLFGPLIGGAMADLFGFKDTFTITGIAMMLAALLVAFGVKEIRTDEQKEAAKVVYSRRAVLKQIFTLRVLFTVMIITALIQIANFSVQPLLALYVGDMTQSDNIAFLSGLAFSATGFGNLVMTRKWGQLGDKYGYEKILNILLIMAAIFVIPQAFATNLWVFIFFRFLFGIAIGGMVPCTTAYIRLAAPGVMQGEMLGYNQSARFLGNVIGPILGGTLAGYTGIPSVFLFMSFMFFVAFFVLLYALHSDRKRHVNVD
ncbi:lmo2377 family MFS transporter [Listeria ivanovii]|uniref:lmo2377 family MFS transporter n=1 Tax=Listeria ivanovii TaxID=1638 RepID=UPI00162826D7|nr:lmo2377 family MFS transporter [Listeria ivanovii]MBC2255151.1 multidrug efflux MFS transporter [Listeria ivanovii]MBM5609224.1 MFS transporter [Listeria ivanovii]MBM5637315.1 MFS transporter [Listeria ivanovii]MBM5707094.1 MFS transporter [Listeria ivanovii]